MPQPGVSGWLALDRAGRRKDYTLEVQQQANMEPTTKARSPYRPSACTFLSPFLNLNFLADEFDEHLGGNF